jgi:predicted acyl esterase
MIPMRDGIKLHTVVWMPVPAPSAPAGCVLDRTPYGAANAAGEAGVRVAQGQS